MKEEALARTPCRTGSERGYGTVVRQFAVCSLGEKGAAEDNFGFTVHTHQQSRVESSPFQSSQTHKYATVTRWLTYNGRRGTAYTPAESESREYCRVKSLDGACFIFVSQTQ